ncbi:MAG: glycosyltransferase family 39 protein [Planctomycetota bacterium]
MQRPSSRQVTGILLGLALAVRIACILTFTPHARADDIETGQIARHILAGEGYSLNYFGPLRPTAAFPPFETYLNVAVHGVLGYGEGSFLVVVLIRSLLSVLTAWVVYRTVRIAFDPTLALWALIVVAFHPAFIFYSSVTPMLTRPPYSMLAIAVVLNRLVHWMKSPSRACLIWFGVASGLGALVQPRLIFFAWIAFAFVEHRRIRAREVSLLGGVRRLGAAVIIAVLVALPWTIRNTLTFGELVWLRSDQGTLFWIGNNPAAKGDFSGIPGPVWPSFDIAPARTLPEGVRRRASEANEVERDHLLFREGVTFVKDNPGRFAELCFARLRFFWFGPARDRASALREALDQLFAVYSGLLLIGIAIGASLVRERFGRVLLLLLLVYTGLHAVTHAGMYYYRMSIEPYALILALEGCRRLFGSRSRIDTQPEPLLEDDVLLDEESEAWPSPIGQPSR